MEAEKFDGNIEYKLKLVDKKKDRMIQLASQLRYRMEQEGNGECTYHLGVADNGEIIGITEKEYTDTLLSLEKICMNNSYVITSIYEKKVVCGDRTAAGKSISTSGARSESISTSGARSESIDKKVYELLIREKNEKKYTEIRVAVSGSVDVGKSTLIGGLITGKTDNGRGSNRIHSFNYPHEILTGRTSSISHNIMGFDVEGNEITQFDNFGKLTWADIVARSSKIISFQDLAGHEKYLKTTIFGLSSAVLDLCFIIVGANMGITNMTKEHIFLCLSLKIPFVILITKIDIVKDRKNVYEDTISKINRLLKLPGIRRIPYKIKNKDDIMIAKEKLYQETIVPIFHISNVTGEGISELKDFLNVVQKRKIDYNPLSDTEYHIDTIFKNVKGVGLVVGGNLVNGSLKVGDKLLLGPIDGKWEGVFVKSLHCKRVPLEKVDFATYCCIGLRNIDKDKIRKGHVIISSKSEPKSTRCFDCDVKVLKSHASTIKVGYEPLIYTSSVRQSCKILNIKNKKSLRDEKTVLHTKNKDTLGASSACEDSKYEDTLNKILRAGDRASITFEFKFRPEFIKEGYRVLISEGRTKAIGNITKIY